MEPTMVLPVAAAVSGVVAVGGTVATLATSGSDPGSLVAIGGYFTPAVILIMMVRGDLASGRENKRLQAENVAKDKLIAEERAKNEKLSASVIEQMVPVITKATEVIAAADASRGRGRT